MVVRIFLMENDLCHSAPLMHFLFLRYKILDKAFHGKNSKVFHFKIPKNMISNLTLPLVAWGYGIVLIAIFALVCMVLVGIVLAMMSADRKKRE